MEFFEEELEVLFVKGKSQGYLTFDELNELLPEDEFSPEKIDELLIQLEDKGIKVVDEPPTEAPARKTASPTVEVKAIKNATQDLPTIPTADLPKLSDDPIRLYLAQMSEIPLLTRDEEINLAKKIERADVSSDAVFSAVTTPCKQPLRLSTESMPANFLSTGLSRSR